MALQGFPPLASCDARLLILGSMPGAASLQAQQYYAHPQNLFWPFMQELFSIPASLPYAQRTRRLVAQDIALWDVIEGCERRGSLDASIRNERPNDFPRFFLEHPRIAAIFFNGRKAESSFRRQVLPGLAATSNIQFFVLPSTSPAHASLPRSEKLKAWRRIGEYLHP